MLAGDRPGGGDPFVDRSPDDDLASPPDRPHPRTAWWTSTARSARSCAASLAMVASCLPTALSRGLRGIAGGRDREDRAGDHDQDERQEHELGADGKRGHWHGGSRRRQERLVNVRGRVMLVSRVRSSSPNSAGLWAALVVTPPRNSPDYSVVVAPRRRPKSLAAFGNELQTRDTRADSAQARPTRPGGSAFPSTSVAPSYCRRSHCRRSRWRRRSARARASGHHSPRHAAARHRSARSPIRPPVASGSATPVSPSAATATSRSPATRATGPRSSSTIRASSSSPIPCPACTS